MVQRRLKSEVWLRDVLNKQISVAENYAIFACVLLLSYLMLGHRIVSLFHTLVTITMKMIFHLNINGRTNK